MCGPLPESEMCMKIDVAKIERAWWTISGWKDACQAISGNDQAMIRSLSGTGQRGSLSFHPEMIHEVAMPSAKFCRVPEYSLLKESIISSRDDLSSFDFIDCRMYCSVPPHQNWFPITLILHAHIYIIRTDGNVEKYVSESLLFYYTWC